MNLDRRSDAEVMDALRRAGQGHVLRWWEELDGGARTRLIDQFRSLDLEGFFRRISEIRAARSMSGTFRSGAQPDQAELPDYIPLPRNEKERAAREEARAAGERLLRAGKVAALTVAGGQGTRLGLDAPKGIYPIGPVSGHSLFQIHAERILASRKRYGSALPWYIMTSDATDQPTRDYFEKMCYFGMGHRQADVHFFRQGMLPALDREFRLVLVAKDAILLSPNGHGGTFSALAETGMLDDMKRRGIEEISYFQVDNPLVPAADPVFLGCHSLASAEMSSKALWKREPEEPVGAFVKVGGSLIVKEYSDLTREQMYEKTTDECRVQSAECRMQNDGGRRAMDDGGDSGGKLLYGLGSVAIHAIRVDFVRREVRSGINLPMHLAEKSSPCLDESGALVQPKEKNVYKFEMFIFDALRDARRTLVLEIRREEEFSPVKNATGRDSPETCKRDMTALYADWLEAAGVHVPREILDGRPTQPIEISPLFALDAAELAARIPKGFNLPAEPVYLGPTDY